MSRTAKAQVGLRSDALVRPGSDASTAQNRRIIFINRYFAPDMSATSQMLTDLARVLAKDRFDLHVICSRQLYDDPRARLAPDQRLGGAHVHRSWSTRFGRKGLLGRSLDYLSFYASSTMALLRLVRCGDVVVAMTDPPLISVCAAAVARLRHARFINWLQDVFPEVATTLGALRLPRWIGRAMLAARNWSLQVADTNVVLGIGMRRRISELCIPKTKIRVIENWADADSLVPMPAKWSALRRNLAPGDQFVVQYSGNLGRAHDFDTVLGAALRLRDEPDWLFLMIGSGVNMHRLRARALQLQLRNMRFLPHQPRESLADSLSVADVHWTSLLPGLEGLIVPSKLYGILAAGRPVIIIGDPDGEQARVIRGAHCGSAIVHGDSMALVGELRRMRSDPEWMRVAGIRARALFERRYTLTAASRKWMAVLDAASQSCSMT